MRPEQWDPVFVAMTESYPAWKPTEETSIVWFKTLGRFDSDVVKQAIIEVGMEIESQYPPSLFQVLKRAQEITCPDDGVDEIWEQVRAKLQKGDYDVSEFSSAAQKAIKAVGGMANLGMTDIDEMQWRKKDFIRAYSDYREQYLANPKVFESQALDAPKNIKALINGVIK